MNLEFALEKTPEWKAQWRKYIGGGRSAAAAGIHEHMTPLELYMSMVEGVEPDINENEDMLRGIMLEHVAIQRLRMQHPELDFIPHDQDDFVRNTRYPWASDLPDFWATWKGRRRPGQVKVPRPENFARLDEHIPYYIQSNCVHSCAVNDEPVILLACMNPVTMALRLDPYPATEGAVTELMAREGKFWFNHIVPKVPPPPQTKEDLKLLWPRHTEGKVAVATEEVLAMHRELMPLKAQKKHLKGRIEDLDLSIQKLMGDAELLVDQDHAELLATWRSHSHTDFQKERLQEEEPEVYERYVIQRDQRTFIPKKPGTRYRHTRR